MISRHRDPLRLTNRPNIPWTSIPTKLYLSPYTLPLYRHEITRLYTHQLNKQPCRSKKAPAGQHPHAPCLQNNTNKRSEQRRYLRCPREHLQNSHQSFHQHKGVGQSIDVCAHFSSYFCCYWQSLSSWVSSLDPTYSRVQSPLHRAHPQLLAQQDHLCKRHSMPGRSIPSCTSQPI